MSERMAEARANTYPGFIGTDPVMACAARFKWGSLQITKDAVDAYGLSINTEALEENKRRSLTESQLRFSADILIAGPQEVLNDGNPDMLMFGYKPNRSGVRATLGTNIDKDLAGVDLASRLITAMASELPEEEQPTFLMQRGVEIQDAVKDQVSLLFPHGFAHTTSKLIADSFEQWANRQAARRATSIVNRASAVAILGTGIINGADWYPDGTIQGPTALFTLGYVGFLAMKARSQIRQTIEIAPAIASTSRRLAQSISQGAEKDIHNLLCRHSQQ